MTQDDLDMILNAGLEKIAYEEALNDYADSLEKVAGVHGVDAVDLHDFLEKVAEATDFSDESKKELINKARRHQAVSKGLDGVLGGSLLGMAGGFARDHITDDYNLKGTTIGGIGGAALGGYLGSRKGAKKGEENAKKSFETIQRLLNDPETPESTKRSIKDQIGNYNVATKLKKTAGIDDDTLNYLFEQGLEKIAEEQSKLDKAKKWVKENPKKVGVGIGALGGLGYAGMKLKGNKPSLLERSANKNTMKEKLKHLTIN